MDIAKTILTVLVAGTLAAAWGCDTATCFTLAKKECNLCDHDGDTAETYCTCILDGKLDRASSSVDFPTDDAAALWCDSLLSDLKRSGSDYGAYCRRELSMYNQWGEEWCDGIQYGYGDDDTYYYW